MAEDDFTFQHLETDEDVVENLELMRKVFGSDEGVDNLVRKLIDHHPSMTLRDHFVIKHRGRMVANLNLIPVEWGMGGVPLKVAEMGCVGTHPEYRRRGLIRRLVKEFHRRVSEQGYDLSVIEGIPFFYRQFGYEYAVPLGEETRIRVDQIPYHETEHEVRPFTRADIPWAMELLSQTQEKFYLHSVRDPRIWEMQEKTGMASDYMFEGYAVEEGGEVVAYLRISVNTKEKELVLMELTDTDQLTAQTVLRFLKEEGRRRGLETLVARISYQNPITEHLTAVGAVKRIPPYAWQIRVTDHVRMFWKMKPLFEARLAGSTFRRLTERLNFNFRSYTVQMTVDDGVISDIQRLETNEDRTIGLNPLAFTQLLLGHRSRQELEMTYPDFRIRSSHRHLIDVLFPKLPSYIHATY